MKYWFPNHSGNFIIVNRDGVFTYRNGWFTPEGNSKNPVLVTTQEMPLQWVDRVEDIKERISNGSIQKEIAHWDFKFKGGSPIKWLKEQEGNGRFIVQLDDDRLLYGNSPELVLEKSDSSISIEVLGGTGEWNDKTSEEHSIIIQDLVQRFPEPLNINQTELIDIGYVKHLKTKLSGSWHHSLQSIIPYIWPNLAIDGKGCGEDYWGGLIGWGDEKYARLWLCIRCGIWDGEYHHFRVGCGITQKSEPLAEWEELNKKLGWVLKLN